ncbi:MAG: hypothetical protein A2736_00265 [Candidatus Yanofskybacteria bacterium RIFCSPHIGHO2_01_FULL_41_27]|uniref:Uncharacterized protein n=2 Tax=Candidatus Yanofskyibacteriota TaxID=1752733 RepID=A0A1F8HWH8_9BACT|nr:MAG: hypothetical protein A2736_00265 [Candidatus Yanofskybacteria bacterium RIFCSPHIGHO2_01_FULL_41_27]OGN20437.1 MAG: hypothetical protein A3B00_00930 [Candidatus Yanofskybacteria bacterium RIFCSPLOWO2_01_FULL_41_33]OGN41498.1 MAG: hypothetical protein A2606_03215 [Candidatus Yanofskybacteria bacterium RIFOXYD1_FULL_42_10]
MIFFKKNHLFNLCSEQPPHIAGSRQGGDWNLLFGLPRQGRGVADILKFPTADERGAGGYALFL